MWYYIGVMRTTKTTKDGKGGTMETARNTVVRCDFSNGVRGYARTDVYDVSRHRDGMLHGHVIVDDVIQSVYLPRLSASCLCPCWTVA